jgi:hypothetical protein
MEKSIETQIRALFAKLSIPPLDIIIPILQKTGRGEKELTAQVYETYVNLAKRMREIMGYSDNSMKTLAKVWEMAISFEGGRFVPHELTESKFSFSMSDCPMLHVGKDISFEVKSKFCDLICTAGSRGLMDTVLAPSSGRCNWNKALIKGEGKCTVVFEVVGAP